MITNLTYHANVVQKQTRNATMGLTLLVLEETLRQTQLTTGLQSLKQMFIPKQVLAAIKED